jgi:hypothetical protein
MTDDVERLLGQVRRFQRQARRVTFARALGVTAGLAFAVVAVWTLTARTEPALHAFVLGMAALSAILIAALAAWLRTPSLQHTGSAIDGSLKLEDRVVAALQLYRAPDVVAGLVVSDAVRKLHGTSPEHVFPMRVGWWAAPALAGAGLVVVAMALNPASPLTTSSPNGAGGSGSATRAAQAGQGEASAARAGDATSNAKPQPAFAPDGASASAPRASADKSSGKPSAPEAPNAPAAPVAPVAPSRTQSHPVAPASAPPGATAGKPVAPDARGESPTGTSAASARAAGSDNPDAPRAGGVGGAPTSERTIGPLGRSPRSAMSAPAVAAARAQAEAAIGRGEIPPGFRKYVRDYFTAIQRSPPTK